ncbi:hypothetical protein HK102_001561 [Quaeritorhiza haematococci]|nr:hypothetical protein HK102_001561 [Quaeritorhiza haematococci]
MKRFGTLVFFALATAGPASVSALPQNESGVASLPTSTSINPPSAATGIALPPPAADPAAPQNFFSEVMNRVDGIISGQGVLDVNSIIAVGMEFIQRIQKATSDPQDAIKQGTELVDAILGKLREKNVEAGTVFAVEQSLKGALNIADAIIPPKEEKKMKGCWLGEFVRFGKIPNHCSDPNKELVALQCLDKCAEGFTAVGPLCWRGIEPRMRGEAKWAECQPGHLNIAGLCYDKPCGNNFDREFGAMCIATKCPPSAPQKCGRLCLSEGVECGKFVGDLVDKGKDAVMEAAQLDIAGAIGPVADMIRTLASFPQCFEKP